MRRNKVIYALGHSNMRLWGTAATLRDRFPEDEVVNLAFNASTLRPDEATNHINSWDPEVGVRFQQFKNEAEIRGTARALCLLQGELEGNTEENAEAFRQRLPKLIEAFRCTLKQPRLPIIIGRVGNHWPRANVLREIEEAYEKEDRNFHLINLDDINRGREPWNFTPEGRAWPFSIEKGTAPVLPQDHELFDGEVYSLPWDRFGGAQNPKQKQFDFNTTGTWNIHHNYIGRIRVGHRFADKLHLVESRRWRRW